MKTATEQTHTPGPWKVFGSFKNIVHQMGDKFEVLAEIKYPLFSMNVGEAKANARLIAAAPELLELLRWAEERNRNYTTINSSALYDERTWGEAVKQAIAKAEGRA